MTVKVTTNYEPDPTDREWECPCIVRNKDLPSLIVLALRNSEDREKSFYGLVLEGDDLKLFSTLNFMKEFYKPYDRKVTLQNYQGENSDGACKLGTQNT